MIKKWFALLLAALMILSLAACGGGDARDDASGDREEKTDTDNPSEEGGEDDEDAGEDSIPEAPALDPIVLDFAELTLESVGIDEEVTIQMGEGWSTSSMDEEGAKALYLMFKIKNTSKETISSARYFAGSITVDGYTYETHELSGVNGFDLDPLKTASYAVYAQIPDELIDSGRTFVVNLGFDPMFSQDKNWDYDNCDIHYTFTVTKDGDSLSVENTTAGADAAPAEGEAAPVGTSNTMIAPGDTIATSEYSFKLNNVELTYELKPGNTSGVYSSYKAESGKVYIHIDADYTNTSKRDVNIKDLPVPSADYDSGYGYTGFVVIDDGDNDFDWASSYVACTPLETCHYHGLIECPEVVDNSSAPLFVTFTLADGVTYQYNLR